MLLSFKRNFKQFFTTDENTTLNLDEYERKTVTFIPIFKGAAVDGYPGILIKPR